MAPPDYYAYTLRHFPLLDTLKHLLGLILLTDDKFCALHTRSDSSSSRRRRLPSIAKQLGRKRRREEDEEEEEEGRCGDDKKRSLLIIGLVPYRMEKLFSDFRRSGMCRSIGAGVNINRLATALIIDGRRRNESFAVPSLFNQVERDVETLSVCSAPSLAENREEERIFLHISRAA